MIRVGIEIQIDVINEFTANELEDRIRRNVETLCSSFEDSVIPVDSVRRQFSDFSVVQYEMQPE